MGSLVLLSGGLDSVAALHHERSVSERVVEAVSFDYGQPNRDAEMSAAQRIAERRGVRWHGIQIGEAVRGLKALVPPPRGVDNGVSRANLPGRNAIMLSIAAALGARLFGGEVRLVVGANADDAETFPDCRAAFFDAAEEALGKALAGVAFLHIAAPWVGMRKRDIVGWCRAHGEDAVTDIRDSMSCYRGTRCGDCDPCAFRAEAFAANGLVDGAWVPRMVGGDGPV